MEIFFLLIVGYFVLPFLLGLAKPKTEKSKPKRQAWSNQLNGDQPPRSRPEQNNKATDLRSRLQAAQTASRALSQKRAASQKKTMSQKAAGKDTVKPGAKDYLDRNNRRRTDWGRRAGPEIISTQNILLGIMFAAIIYLVLQVISTF